MPRPRSYRLSPDLVAAYAGGSVVCLDASASGRSYRLHAQRPTGYDVVRADVTNWIGEPVEVDAPDDEAKALAIVEVYGPLEQRCGYHSDCGGYADGHDAIAERLCAAMADPAISTVLLIVDSPGGAAAGLQEAVGAVQRAKAASGGKQVIAYAREMIASAAYWWVACVADEIYTPAAGQIGSIGARAAHGSVTGALAKEGVEVTFFAWPPGKIALASELPLSELGKARGDRDVRECAETFFAAVGPARGLSHKDLMNLNADCLSGAAAVAAGLADGVATFDDVMSYALTLSGGAGEKTMSLRAEGGDAPEKKGPPAGDDAPEAEGAEPSTACSSCSMANEPNAKFCDQCGASMAAAPADEEPDSERSPKPGASAAAVRAPASLAAYAGLRPGASMPAIITALGPRIAVFDAAMRLTGSANPREAIGGLTALAEDAKRGVKAEKDLKSAKIKAAGEERWQLAHKLAAANIPGHERGKIITDGVDADGKRTMSLTPYIAEMKLDTLRGHVNGLTAGRDVPRANPFEPSIERAQAASEGAPGATNEQGNVVVSTAAKRSTASEEQLAASFNALAAAGAFTGV